MRSPRLTAIACVMVLLGSACRKEIINNVPRRAPINAPLTLTMADMTEVLVDAGERAGWRMRTAGPGRMRAEKVVRVHRAVTEIGYDERGYSITLLQADNLLYDGEKVHKVYNDWIEELQKSIDDEVRFRYP